MGDVTVVIPNIPGVKSREISEPDQDEQRRDP
jgi:hypothetical protein